MKVTKHLSRLKVKSLPFLATTALVASPIAFGKNHNRGGKNSCKSVVSCVELVSKLTGVDYSSSAELKGKVWQSNSFKITKDNADSYLSEVLNDHGYTRIQTNKNRYRIVQARDVRYTPTKMLNGNTDKIPKSDDYMMVSFNLKDKEMSSDYTRAMRPFMSRYGRIIDVKHIGQIILQDTGRNINRILKLIKSMDKIPTKEELEAREDRHERHYELEKLRAKHCPKPPKK
jgi:general secretion pathway protein D